MRALESPSQLREQMTWFWMNHFSVFSGKANVRWTLAEYEEQAVRAHALGTFSDLVMATATSPAMLEYLDNAQSAVGKINENYARELMELHTLGVSGGPSGSTYTQQDVQELARVLTGVGLNLTRHHAEAAGPASRRSTCGAGSSSSIRRATTSAAKTVLGHAITGQGLAEIEDAVVLLCRQPATARFISTKLATYFVADEPPPALVERMTRTFQKTDGSIAAVLREMFLDRAFIAALERADADGSRSSRTRCNSSCRRCGWPTTARRSRNYHPAVGWLQQLGEPLYGRVTPDGYPLTEAAWSSSGQMVRRFEIARAIGSGNAGLFNNDDNTPGPATGFPMLTSRLFFDAIEPALGARTRDALGRTVVAAGMEHDPAGVAGLDAAVGLRTEDVMAFSRRDLLKLALVGAAHPLLPMRGIVSQAFAAPGAADAKFLLVFLRGGYDAANVVIPVGSDFYYEVASDDRAAETGSGESQRRHVARAAERRRRCGACIRRSRTRCCRSGRRASSRSCRSPAPRI